MGSGILVNPLAIYSEDQIHAVFGSPEAVPTNPDLV